MAQSITIQGATYTGVPAVDLPKTGGGTARFMDTTDADAVATNIASGKKAYVNSVLVTGTASMATATVSGTILTLTDGFPVIVDESINYNMMYLHGTKGFRQLNGTISGNGTDPNWLWWDLVSTDGYTQVKYYLQGYTTVASIMWFDSNRTKLSEIHGSGVLTGVVDIPSGASYVAISTRQNESGSYIAQYCYMY